MDKPKIALCFTGHIRTLKDNYINLQNTVIDTNKYQYDIYFITWAGEPETTIRECFPGANIIMLPTIDTENAEFCEWAKQIEMHISWRRTFPDPIKCKFRYFAQIYLLREVARRINFDRYHAVIRCRPDIRITEPIHHFFENIEENSIYFSDSMHHGAFGNEREGCTTFIFWGPPKSMHQALHVLDGTVKYSQTYFEPQVGQMEYNILQDESTIYKYLVGEGLTVKFLDFTLNFIRRTFSGNSEDHLQFFMDKMTKCESFALIRPNDGEYMILQGEHFTNIDNWTFSGGSLREELDLSIRSAARLKDSYVGIPCADCWTREKTDWYIQTYGLDAEHLTYGNIVCNKNWKTLIDYLHKERTEINYIGPGTATTTHLNVVSRHTISAYLLNEWNSKKNEAIEAIDRYIRERITCVPTWQLFFFSAGPISKILIPYFFGKYPGHTFIDIGSAFDVFLKGSTNRGYIGPNSDFGNVVCDFKSGHGKTAVK